MFGPKTLDFINSTANSTFQQNPSTRAQEDEDQFEKDAKIDAKSGPKLFTQQEIEDALISNALLLFFAGFDTSSTGRPAVPVPVLHKFVNLTIKAMRQPDALACTWGGGRLGDSGIVELIPKMQDFHTSSCPSVFLLTSRLMTLQFIFDYLTNGAKQPGVLNY